MSGPIYKHVLRHRDSEGVKSSLHNIRPMLARERAEQEELLELFKGMNNDGDEDAGIEIIEGTLREIAEAETIVAELSK